MILGHIHLKVSDLKAAEKFYTEILGLNVTERVGDEYIFLSFGKFHHDLALRNMGKSAPRPSSDSTGLYHVAFEVANEKELGKIYRKLKVADITCSAVDHGISKSLYFKDSDGNGIEVYVDTRHVRKGWMGITTHFDPETL